MLPTETLIITGLPRSGTSLMMQMLHAAGMPILADNHRPPDANNPHGYFEWAPALTLPSNPAVLAAATGKAVKILTPLLPYLPPGLRCRILFMRRPLEEIALSQHAMRFGSNTPIPPEMLTALRQHLDASLALLARSNHTTLHIDYPNLVADPSTWIERILDFIGHESLPKAEDLQTAIAQNLRRITC